METETWIAPTPKSVITKLKASQDFSPPEVSLLSSQLPRYRFLPRQCHVVLEERREELHEDVYLGEVLPNHEGTFQMSVDLKVSSISPEDWRRYKCVFQVSGVKEDIVTKLDEDSVQSNRGLGGRGGVLRDSWQVREKPISVTTIIIITAVALAVVSPHIGLIVYRRKKAQVPHLLEQIQVPQSR
ncbi:unnamed protein product [Pleuronectes platessa]|uniref:Uncharacterized protein n=1 Tax=Pleuronectes platessa TaxID=8262 RepID=A0A9N7UKB8_PLEPL|nr:unnamed protein product [Pleuronectes platessa]